MGKSHLLSAGMGKHREKERERERDTESCIDAVHTVLPLRNKTYLESTQRVAGLCHIVDRAGAAAELVSNWQRVP